MENEFWINVHFDHNGDLTGGQSHADYDVAVIYADEGTNYLHTIHYSAGRARVVDLTDAIREYRADAALERRHELSFSGA